MAKKHARTLGLLQTTAEGDHRGEDEHDRHLELSRPLRDDADRGIRVHKQLLVDMRI